MKLRPTHFASREMGTWMPCENKHIFFTMDILENAVIGHKIRGNTKPNAVVLKALYDGTWYPIHALAFADPTRGKAFPRWDTRDGWTKHLKGWHSVEGKVVPKN